MVLLILAISRPRVFLLLLLLLAWRVPVGWVLLVPLAPMLAVC